MTRRTLLLLYVLSVALVVTVILLKRSASRSGSGSARRESTVQAAHPRSEEPTDDELAGGVTTPAERPVGPPASPDHSRLRGSVVCADPSAPLAGHVVHITTLGAREAVDLREDGSFELDLDPDAWGFGSLVTAAVRDATGKLLLSTPVTLGEALELRVPAPVRLAGRLSFAPPRDGAGRTVTVYTSREDGTASRLYFGSGTLAADDEFSVEVLEPVRPVRYLLEFDLGSGSSFLAAVPRAELVSEVGATIARQWAEVTFQVRGEEGAPLSGVTVRIAESVSARDPIVAARRTGARGRAIFALTTGEYTFCATLAGHAPRIGTFSVEPGRLSLGVDVELRALDAADVLRGVILSPIEEPIAGALVELRPAVPIAGLAPSPIASTHTTHDGRFELRCDPRALLDLSARHPEHGTLERSGVTIDERRLRLKFDVVGAVRIDIRDGETSDAIAEAVQYIVLDGERRVAGSGRAQPPLNLEGLAAGLYEVLVLGPGGSTYGHTRFTIETLSTLAVAVDLQPSGRATGYILDRSGAPAGGVLVRIERPDEPKPVRSAWGTTVSAADGSFTLPLRGEIRASISAGGAQAVVVEGEPQEIVVDAQ